MSVLDLHALIIFLLCLQYPFHESTGFQYLGTNKLDIRPKLGTLFQSYPILPLSPDLGQGHLLVHVTRTSRFLEACHTRNYAARCCKGMQRINPLITWWVQHYQKSVPRKGTYQAFGYSVLLNHCITESLQQIEPFFSIDDADKV